MNHAPNGNRLLAALLLALSLLAADARSDEPAPTDKRGAVVASHRQLSPARRVLLLYQMDRHAGDMVALVTSVILLDYAEAERHGTEIAAAPREAAHFEATTGQASRLPARFLDLQDLLGRRAQALVEAARQRDAHSLTRAFAKVTETCVSCHIEYRGQRARRR